MEPRRARLRRRRRRRVAVEIRGEMSPLLVKLDALQRERDRQLDELGRAYTAAMIELQLQFRERKKAIWTDYHATADRLRAEDRAEPTGLHLPETGGSGD